MVLSKESQPAEWDWPCEQVESKWQCIVIKSQTATCNDSNVWTAPASDEWELCIDSKSKWDHQGSPYFLKKSSIIHFPAEYCDIPPNGQEGMLIFANSTGNRFGAVCLGSKISPNLTPGHPDTSLFDKHLAELSTECGTIYVEYKDSEMSPGSALYREI